MQNLDLIPLRRGFQALSSAQNTVCTSAGTYYKIGGTWTGTPCIGFERDGSGKITYIDGDGVTFLFNGASDLKVDKNATIWYSLYKNGVLVPAAQTPVTFNNANSYSNISITSYVDGLQYGDYLEIYCKSDQASTTVTSATLLITFLGDR